MSDPQSSTTKLHLTAGNVRGTESGGIRRFLGIPYALPPFDERRFRLPEPVPPWEGERDATQFGATAPQSPYPGAIGELLSSVEIAGDDILTANVWTPVEAHSLPVMVWFHGGALERGTPALSAYDGSAFARDGVVFVSIAYRVGSEGFSVLEGAPCNLGLADAAAGLRWVHDEITHFGGDPNRITIVGESAGGAIVAALLSRPDTVKLVAGAAIESAPLVADSMARAGRVTRALAKRLGLPATRDAFAQITPRILLEERRQQSAGGSPLGGAPGFALAIDPDTLPLSPHEALVNVEVPLLIGTNTDEYRLWFPPAALAAITTLKFQLGRLALGISSRAVKLYRAAWPHASTGELFGQIATDVLLRKAAVSVAEKRRANSFVYEFAWQSPVRELKAAHAIEIGFVFDQLNAADSVRMAGRLAPQALADQMHADWVRFIRTGDPGWPAYGAQRTTQLYDTATTAVALRRADALDSLPAPKVR
ncbi:carboxylesterase/lipase family protein [Microbacterium marmarense]|uniref:Carboxylic ester hydrolase n=1 Tax=Microbacterium marmarense TaxID=3122051 RepID=A0ABU8LUM8_9MICO